ncbi:MAG: aldo/keto reductase [Monoglobales bacterium]
MEKLKLRNGYEIPCIGFGTWQIPDGEAAENAVLEAVKAGYRHIDTANAYKNEPSVGKAVRECGISREELFVTTKLWNSKRGYDNAMKAFEKSMELLGLDYIDLYLIHWPASKSQYDNWDEINLSSWKALTELYKTGRIKSIGVSNFKPHHLKSLIETEVPPMVNQIEFHPGQMQQETVDLCRQNNIIVEAWSPLGSGRMLDNDELKKIAAKYNKSVAQLCIRWCLQNGTLPLPKSQTPSRIKENIDVFDFEISEEDMVMINNMEYFDGSGYDPDKVDF